MAIQSAVASSLSFLLYGKPASADTTKTIVITGANSGIGFEAAKKLAADGHTIVLACRSLEKATGAAERIKATAIASSSLIPAECDLASLNSIRKFASEIGNMNIDVLCLNAGLSMNTNDKEINRTEDGFELTVGINHLGHFYLSDLLLPKINKQSGRIVVTASGGKFRHKIPI
jgi:protochlorophyllide reductase